MSTEEQDQDVELLELEDAGIKTKITIKFGGGFDDPWDGPLGTPEQLKNYLITEYNLDPEESAGLTLSELVIKATLAVQKVYNAAKTLGGSPVSTGRGRRGGGGNAAKRDDVWSKDKKSDPPFEAPHSDEPEHPHAALIAQIENAQTKADVGRIWKANQEAYSDADVMAAHQAAKARVGA